MYRFGGSRYEITVENPDRVERGVTALTLDGVPVEGGAVPLVDDGGTHRVVARLGA